MLCSNCGAALKLKSNFCGKCGFPVKSLEGEQELEVANEGKATNKEISQINKKSPNARGSKKEIFIAAIKLAMIKGDISDPLKVDRKYSSKSKNTIRLSNSEGKVLSEITVKEVQEFINHPNELNDKWEWGNDILKAWERNLPDKLINDHKRNNDRIGLYIYVVIYGIFICLTQGGGAYGLAYSLPSSFILLAVVNIPNKYIRFISLLLASLFFIALAINNMKT